MKHLRLWVLRGVQGFKGLKCFVRFCSFLFWGFFMGLWDLMLWRIKKSFLRDPVVKHLILREWQLGAVNLGTEFIAVIVEVSKSMQKYKAACMGIALVVPVESQVSMWSRRSPYPAP